VVNSVAINPYKVAAPFRQFFRRRRFRGVTIVNVWFPEVSQGFRYILGDGCQLPIGDKSVDLAFSNSAIEHVGDFERQRRFAAELMRIGKTIYCQTPCRLFPVDPHLGTPFVHWLPRRCLTSKFLRYFTLNGWLVRKGYEYDVTWLSRNQLQAIFPGCDIKTERFLGLPKSFIITSPS
jgi:ubiquinone/menaquinone biosynthesis C-methylase UbiE